MYKLILDDRGYHRCDPLPSQSELDMMYVNSFYTEDKPDYIKRVEDDEKWWKVMYGDRLDIMNEVYRKSSKKMWPMVLDIGSGPGLFCRCAIEQGWYAVGIEPNNAARSYAQDKQKHFSGGVWFESSLENVKEERFWGVHISEVLEHVIDPIGMLSEAYDRLVPGGVLCVVVPNEQITMWEDELKLLHLFRYPHAFQPPQHVNYFTFETIEKLITDAGFEIYERSAMYPMETFLMMGLDYTKSEGIGRLCHHQRMLFDMGMESKQRRRFYKELAAQGLGREAVIYGVKK